MTNETRTATAGRNTVVAEICLYGTRQTGAGYILSIHAAGQIVRLGTGEPKADRSFTEAVWIAAGLLNVAGITKGIVHVYEPTGEKFAAFDLAATHVPNYGDLKWTAGGTVFVLSAAEIQAAAEKPLTADQRDGGARFEAVQNAGIDY